jgi:hypothetical protein
MSTVFHVCTVLRTVVIWLCAHSFSFGCMWIEWVASGMTGLQFLRAVVYDIQSSYFCDKLYFVPNVSICLVKEGTMFCFLDINSGFHALLPLPIFPYDHFL